MNAYQKYLQVSRNKLDRGKVLKGLTDGSLMKGYDEWKKKRQAENDKFEAEYNAKYSDEKAPTESVDEKTPADGKIENTEEACDAEPSYRNEHSKKKHKK